MYQKVLKTIYDNNMFQKGEKVIIAVSGGPDSICLLHLLHRMQEQLDISIVAAHLNHSLRGKEADEDEAYVRSFCENIGIEFFVKKVDVYDLAKKKGISCEMAGREARYAFFEELLTKLPAQKITLAHNANDQAETILMRMMRGTGIEGLVGIRPVRDEIFIRPILYITREEIEAYCKEHQLKPRLDRSNLENIYTRNKVRLELIPYLKKNFNEDIIHTLNRLSDMVKNDQDYLEKVAYKNFKSYCDRKDDKVIIYKDAFLQHEAILTRVIRLAILKLKGNIYNLEKVHIYDMIKLQKQTTGKSIALPNNIIVENVYGDIFIYNKEEMVKIQQERYTLSVNSKQYIQLLNKNIILSIIDYKPNIVYEMDPYTKHFDYDKIKGEIILRYREIGDRFTPLGMKGSKKLKDFFMDLKIPKAERERIPLVCFGEEIAWIVGYRISEKFKVEKETKHILQIKFKKGE